MARKNINPLILVISVLIIFWFLSSNQDIFIFGTTNLQGYPKSAGLGSGEGGDFDIFKQLAPKGNFFGDYLISVEGKFSASCNAGRTPGCSASNTFFFGSLNPRVGCSIGTGVSCSSYNPPPDCYSASKSETKSMQIIINSKERTIQCNYGDVWKEQNFGTTNVLEFESTAGGGSNEASGSFSTGATINYITIDDLTPTSFINYNIYDTFDKPVLDISKWQIEVVTATLFLGKMLF